MFRQLLITLVAVSLFAPYVLAQQQSTEGLDMQAARAKMMTVRGRKIAYTTKWELGGLRKYLLTRGVSIYVNRAPGKPIDPNVKEFLRYILSQEGQQDLVREGDYLPLSEATVREQLRKLE